MILCTFESSHTMTELAYILCTGEVSDVEAEHIRSIADQLIDRMYHAHEVLSDAITHEQENCNVPTE
jgi:uncharacterized protein (UPF0261 family)